MTTWYCGSCKKEFLKEKHNCVKQELSNRIHLYSEDHSDCGLCNKLKDRRFEITEYMDLNYEGCWAAGFRAGCRETLELITGIESAEKEEK